MPRLIAAMVNAEYRVSKILHLAWVAHVVEPSVDHPYSPSVNPASAAYWSGFSEWHQAIWRAPPSSLIDGIHFRYYYATQMSGWR